MKTIVTAALLGIGLLSCPVQAKDMSTIWTTIRDNSPRSVFDDLRDSAPRSVFDQLNQTAPRMAQDNSDGFVGELTPAFELLRRTAR